MGKFSLFYMSVVDVSTGSVWTSQPLRNFLFKLLETSVTRDSLLLLLVFKIWIWDIFDKTGKQNLLCWFMGRRQLLIVINETFILIWLQYILHNEIRYWLETKIVKKVIPFIAWVMVYAQLVQLLSCSSFCNFPVCWVARVSCCREY